MQFNAFFIEEEIVIRSIHLWKVRTNKKRREFDIERVMNNVKSKEKTKKYRERALQAEIEEFKYLKVYFRFRFFYQAIINKNQEINKQIFVHNIV